VLLGALVLLQVFGGDVVTAVRAVTEEILSLEVLSNHDARSVGGLLVGVGVVMARAMAPLLLGVALVAVVVNIAQVGFVLNSKRLQPNFKALSPANGLKRLFGGGAGWMKLAMNLTKVSLVGIVAYSAVHGRLDQIVTVQQLSFLQIFGLSAEVLYSISMRLAVLLLVLALLDYLWQRYSTERKLKMTKQEVRDELKKMEGDPLIKQRRRQIALQRAMQRVQSAVPQADVIVTNPTEYAVAIRYEQDMTAPKVVAKGRGFVAQKIREIAVANGIPILERPPLARALWRMVEVGQEIPEQFYAAVAEILAYVYELTGKVQRRATA
jgi:flagellar biosynthesis protein FlhB